MFFSHRYFKLASALAALVVLTGAVRSQSADPAFPTPVTSNELSGVIKARDLGDPRLTTYYYIFDGGQGDIFINVVSKNFSGDIDVFTETGLRPLTKMVFYADAGLTETGRLVYLRRPERLILRVQGRPPGDDPATFQIKFAGSFIALAPAIEDKAPTVESDADDTGVTVNSVGTIVAVKPRPKATAKPIEPADDTVARGEKGEKGEAVRAPIDSPSTKPADRERKAKPVVVVEEFPGRSDEVERSRPKPGTAGTGSKPGRTKPSAKPGAKPSADPAAEARVDPLANVRLVVTMKDGAVIEKKLTELVRFSFDKGVLTIIGKDGNITRYPMVEVDKVTVQ